MCSDELSKVIDNCEPSEAQLSDDAGHANHTAQFNSESTPPPKSDDAPEINGSGKQSKKTKRTPWYNVRIQSLAFSSVSTVYARVHFAALT